ncbi:hypothetical protein AVEN_59024-1 [Araneus ventricosus]|uniref:Tc1-like transposase DDE domain-containing protein n=1 Tax=Araneus ventricosus TaxID=182803 RepID=A0A4Y2UTF1_ARAVE|nr:hypothetical protein AVEN_59024-1 [Araneus ventricosus]
MENQIATIKETVKNPRRKTVVEIVEHVLSICMIRRKRPDLWKAKWWVIHPDNAPTHRSLLVSNYQSKHNIPVLPQPVYSPDLAPCEFFPFHRMQNLLKGQQFSSSETVQRRRHRRRW